MPPRSPCTARPTVPPAGAEPVHEPAPADGRTRRRTHPTLAVEDVTPRRLEPHQADGVALGDAREFLALEDLELE